MSWDLVWDLIGRLHGAGQEEEIPVWLGRPVHLDEGVVVENHRRSYTLFGLPLDEEGLPYYRRDQNLL